MVVQSVEPWMSESDIHPGRRWSHTLASQLEESNVGIVCLTKENINNLWLMFEAGALA